VVNTREKEGKIKIFSPFSLLNKNKTLSLHPKINSIKENTEIWKVKVVTGVRGEKSLKKPPEP
jgi:hypothetical protein